MTPKGLNFADFRVAEKIPGRKKKCEGQILLYNVISFQLYEKGKIIIPLIELTVSSAYACYSKTLLYCHDDIYCFLIKC